MANLPSSSTYPHVLYANQYSVFKVHSAYTPINKTKGNSLTYSYATSKSKIFAGGDIAGCKGTVAWAARSGRDAADSIVEYLEKVGI